MCGKVTLGCKELIFCSVCPSYSAKNHPTPPFGARMGFSLCLLLALLEPHEPQIPLGMFSLPAQCCGCAHSDRWASAKTSRAVAWQAQRPLSNQCTKEIPESRPASPPCSPSPLTRGALEQGKTSLLRESPRLLTGWGIPFLEPGKAVQIHQIFRLHVCGWAKGKLCLVPEL